MSDELTRGEIHVLMLGDPGMAQSTFLQSMERLDGGGGDE